MATYECLVLAFFLKSLAGIAAPLGVPLRDDSGDDISVRGDATSAETSLLDAPLAVSCTGGTIKFLCTLGMAERSGRTWLSSVGASRFTILLNFCFFACNSRSFSSFPASTEERFRDPLTSVGAASLEVRSGIWGLRPIYGGGVLSSMEVKDERDEELETLDVRGLVVSGEDAGLLAGFVFLPILSEILGFRWTGWVSIDGRGIISGAGEEVDFFSFDLTFSAAS